MMRIVSVGPVDHRLVVQSRFHRHRHYFYHYFFDYSRGRAGEIRGPNG